MKGNKPNIFEFHDHVAFLDDWFDHLKSQKSISMREIARRAGLSSGYLPSVLNRNLLLSSEALNKITPYLALSSDESKYLKLIRLMSVSEDVEERERTFEKVERLLKKHGTTPKEASNYRYMSRWYYVAIRELAALPGFQLDPKWIQSRLRPKIHLKEIRYALDFLLAEGLLAKKPKNDQELRIEEGFHTLALHQFYSQMLELEKDAIYEVQRKERSIRSFTVAIPKEDFEEMRQVLYKALEELIKKAKDKKQRADTVYHFSLGAFPLSTQGEGGA